MFKNLFEDKNYIDGLPKDLFREKLTVTMTESFILFDKEYYKQDNGVAMGSPLGHTFANIFFVCMKFFDLKNACLNLD